MTVWGKQGFKAGNEAKIRSLEWTTIQYDWHLYKKRKFEYRHTNGRVCEGAGRRQCRLKKIFTTQKLRVIWWEFLGLQA